MSKNRTSFVSAEQKQKMVRIVAVVACAALLLTAILPYVASSLLR